MSLVAEVQKYALDHYEDGGWDVIVEAFTDEELAEQIKRATTLDEAIEVLSPLIDVWADRQADARNSAF